MSGIRSTIAAAAVAALLVSPAHSEEVFKDDFEGEVLEEHWDVANPNTDNYIVEDGILLIVYQEEIAVENEALPNLFRLTNEMPKGDWQVTIRIMPEYQTMREAMYFGLFQDTANYLLGTWYVNSWCCYARNLALKATKNSGGKKAEFVEALAGTQADLGEGQFNAYRDHFQNLGEAVLLRLTKKGRSYIYSGRVEGKDQSGKDLPWIELPKLTSLRQKGNFVFAFTQSKGGGRHLGGGGESLVNVDWVKIESLK